MHAWIWISIPALIAAPLAGAPAASLAGSRIALHVQAEDCTVSTPAGVPAAGCARSADSNACNHPERFANPSVGILTPFEPAHWYRYFHASATPGFGTFDLVAAPPIVKLVLDTVNCRTPFCVDDSPLVVRKRCSSTFGPFDEVRIGAVLLQLDGIAPAGIARYNLTCTGCLSS